MTLSARPNILLVDDCPILLDSLKTILTCVAPQWDLRFAGDAHLAIALVREAACDVVVSDYRLPGINGVDLLRVIRTITPQAVGIIMTGALPEDAGGARAFGFDVIAKPCSIARIKNAIADALDSIR